MKPEQIETCVIVGLGLAAVVGLVALHADSSLVATLAGGLIGYLTPRNATTAGAAAALLIVGLGLSTASCGPAVSDAQRAPYAGEVAECETNEREIVARTGTTAAEDEAALTAERARCDEARREIESPDGGV